MHARLVLLALAFTYTLMLSGCGVTLEPPKPVAFNAAGSDSVVSIARQLASAFTGQTPNVSIEIEATNSSRALARLAAEEIDFALITLNRPELSQFQQTPIARDGLAIIVHPDNPLTNLTFRDLQHLYSGKILNWREIPDTQNMDRPVQVVTRERDSGMGTIFQTRVLPDQRMTPNARIFPNNQAIVDYVAQTPRAIGYVSTSYLPETVKVVSVEEVLPTPETLTNAAYPLAYLVYLVTPAKPNPIINDFINFLLGPAGQSLLAANGLGRVN